MLARPMWTELAPMHAWRSNHLATPLPDGRVLVCGGIQELSDAEVYDPKEDRWKPTPPMVQPRWNHTATALPDGRVLVVGGSIKSSLESISSAESYDPAADRWQEAERCPTRVRGHAALGLKDGRVLISGGESRAQGSYATCWLFDGSTGKWSPGPKMKSERTRPALAQLS